MQGPRIVSPFCASPARRLFGTMLRIILTLQLLSTLSYAQSVNITDVTETSISLSWPSGISENFTLQYGVGSSLNYSLEISQWTGETVEATADEHLEAGQLYTFQVTGYNNSDVVFNPSPVTQATKPYPPTNVSVTAAAVNSLDVTWIEDSNNNNDIISYVITYKDLTNDSLEAVDQSVNGSPVTLTPLQPGHSYSISLSAVAFNESSVVTEAITDNTVPLPPSNLSLVTVNQSSISISWQPDVSSDQDSYEVSYKAKMDSVGTWTTVNCLEAPLMECTIIPTSGMPGDPYTLEVRAIKGQRRSDPKSLEANTKPLPPLKLVRWNVTTTALQVSWKEADGSRVDDYRVSLYPNDTYVSSKTKTKDALMAWFTGLVQGRTYQVSVTAISGTSESDPVSGVFWTVPEAPNLSFDTTNDTIILTWHAQGERDNYTVVATEDKSKQSWDITSPGTSVQAVVDGLFPGCNYTVTVTANSGDQRSKEAILQGVTTVPNSVEELMVTSRNTNSAVVTWQAPSSPTQLDRYEIRVSNLPDYPKYLQENVTGFNITGLKAGTSYVVEVKVLSGSKSSPGSSIPLITLPPSVDTMTLTSDEDSVTVTWTDPTSGQYTSLNISIKNASGILQTVIKTNSTETRSHTFPGLESGSLYTVYIVVSLGDGTTGKPVEKDIATRPVPVRDVRIKSSELHTLVVEWDIDSSLFNGFLVTVVDKTNSSTQNQTEAESKRNATISGLLPGHHYEVTVQAFVVFADETLYSSPFTVNATTKPLPPADLGADTAPGLITVSWVTSPGDQEYRFRYRPVLRNESAGWIEKFTSLNSEEVKDPFPGEKYVFQVQAKAGDQSSEVRETYAIVVPQRPKYVVVLRNMTTTESLFLELNTNSNVTFASSWKVTYSSIFSPVREIIVTDLTNPIQLSSLGPGETFTVQVYSVTAENVTSTTYVETNGTVLPVLDIELTELNASNSSISLAYTENSPTFDTYHFQLEDNEPVRRSSDPPQEVEFLELTAGQRYTVTSWVTSSEIPSEKKVFSFQTFPNHVKTLWEVFPTEINITLIKAQGLADFYNISCYHSDKSCGQRVVSAIVEPQVESFGPLTAFQDYKFQIITVSGEKFVLEETHHQTTQSAPSAVQNVRAHVTTPNTALVEWDPPAHTNGELTIFKIHYIGKLQNKPDHQDTINLSKFTKPPRNVTVPGLLAGYSYNFSVSAKTVQFGPAGVAILAIASYPPPFKDNLKTEDLLPTLDNPPTPTSVKVKFTNAFSEKGGEIIAYTVIVSTDNSTEQKTSLLLPGWRSAKTDAAIKAYQAIGNCSDFFDPKSDCHNDGVRQKRSTNADFVRFTVGSEPDCESKKKTYCNGPLKPDTDYYVALRAFTAGGQSDTPYSKKIRTDKIAPAVPGTSDNGPLIGGIVGAIILVALILAVVVLFLRRWRRRKPNMYKKEDHEMREEAHVKRSSSRRTRASRIVKLVDFPEHFQLMSADSDYRFAEEFEELREVGRDQSCNAAELPQNRAKNRFTNILPYDHSRVKLLPTDDEEGSDYINANYMPGYNSRREYVVTQGPLPATRDDFWRLLWEQNSRNIIMLTRCVEKGREKCDHYWPQTSENMFYGDLQVAILNETKFPEWTITEFRVSVGDVSRKVRHFHYTAWPDFGVPDRPQSLVRFVKTVREKLIPDGGPQLVHCSAGVGRSGTYIALDRLLQHIKFNDWVDPYSIVHEMRCQRVWMVQTEQQYICIHQCLLSVLQGYDEEPIYCNQAHDNVGFEDETSCTDDEGINVEIM